MRSRTVDTCALWCCDDFSNFAVLRAELIRTTHLFFMRPQVLHFSLSAAARVLAATADSRARRSEIFLDPCMERGACGAGFPCFVRHLTRSPATNTQPANHLHCHLPLANYPLHAPSGAPALLFSPNFICVRAADYINNQRTGHFTQSAAMCLLF